MSRCFLALATLLVPALFACGDDSVIAGGAGGNGGNNNNEGGAGGAQQPVTTSTGTGQGLNGPGCEGCSADEVCVDADHCASACPDGRDACWINADFPRICCQAQDTCCVGTAPGSDVCAASEAACHITCPDGTECSTTGFCQQAIDASAYTCVDSCPQPMQCGGDVCCPLGSRCEGGECLLADLSIDEARVSSSIQIEHKLFAADACEIDEACIDAPGDRRLMRFDLKTPNLGDGDMFLGDPTGSGLFQYSQCHDHYHFLGYARYQLTDENGVVVANGHKQAFCLLDFEALGPNSPAPSYDCGFQGISAGWSDIYGGHLPCQWVDITDVPPGNYTLKVDVNYDQTLAESDYTNNSAMVAVTISSESCPGGCGEPDPLCCDAANSCAWEANGLCDCNGFFPWDAVECGGCPECTAPTTCPGGCTPASDACCDAANSCALGQDGICQCAGTQPWDSADCAQCVSGDPSCAPTSSCPNGCTGPNAACCATGDPCGWAGDGACDCDGGADWDFVDCSTCTCP